MKFKEPYLLAASANDDGMVGSQFFITLGEMPALNGSKNTIFGRVLQGTKTIHLISDINDMRRAKTQYEKLKDEISDNATVENMGLMRRKRDYKEDEDAHIIIKNCGVYKIGTDPRGTSAAGKKDFLPKDFMELRNKKL